MLSHLLYFVCLKETQVCGPEQLEVNRNDCSKSIQVRSYCFFFLPMGLKKRYDSESTQDSVNHIQ